MYSTLINLFNGKISPWERPPIDFPKRRECNKEFAKLKEQFNESLNEHEKELLDKLIMVQASEHEYGEYNAFISGFRLAARLMVDVYHN